jgi:tryptophanyl-tRNA synthetase
MRARREEIDRDPSIVWNALREGSGRARERAAETLDAVRKAMKIDFPELR